MNSGQAVLDPVADVGPQVAVCPPTWARAERPASAAGSTSVRSRSMVARVASSCGRGGRERRSGRHASGTLAAPRPPRCRGRRATASPHRLEHARVARRRRPRSPAARWRRGRTRRRPGRTRGARCATRAACRRRECRAAGRARVRRGRAAGPCRRRRRPTGDGTRARPSVPPALRRRAHRAPPAEAVEPRPARPSNAGRSVIEATTMIARSPRSRSPAAVMNGTPATARPRIATTTSRRRRPRLAGGRHGASDRLLDAEPAARCSRCRVRTKSA